jgi:hypothetical protein
MEAAMARGTRAKVTAAVAKRYWREGDARVVVEAWRGSGVSLSDFAAEVGVHSRRVGRWVARLDGSSGGTDEAGIGFHPVRIVSSVVEKFCRTEAIEVCLGDGRRVRVPGGFVAEDLARVLAVLEGRVSC